MLLRLTANFEKIGFVFKKNRGRNSDTHLGPLEQHPPGKRPDVSDRERSQAATFSVGVARRTQRKRAFRRAPNMAYGLDFVGLPPPTIDVVPSRYVEIARHSAILDYR